MFGLNSQRKQPFSYCNVIRRVLLLNFINVPYLLFSPDLPARIQVPCRTLPLLPKETEALPPHQHPHTETKCYPAAPALLYGTLQKGRKGLTESKTQAPCCDRRGSEKLPGQEEGLEVLGVEGSWGRGMMVPLEQRALGEILKKLNKYDNV